MINRWSKVSVKLFWVHPISSKNVVNPTFLTSKNIFVYEEILKIFLSTTSRTIDLQLDE